MKLEIDKGSPVPIYHQIVEGLKDALKRGELEKGERLPSEMEVSKSLGISPMTARQAYTKLVEEGLLLRKHGSGTYVNSAPASATRKPFKKSGLDFGVLLFNIRAALAEEASGSAGQAGRAFSVELLLGLESACAARGANLHILSANGKSLKNSGNAVVEELLANRRMDGLILAGTPLRKEDLDCLASLEIPLVSVDADYKRPEIGAVIVDDEAFVERAVAKLKKDGVERILLATGPTACGALKRRGARLRDAFFKTLEENGLKKPLCKHCECEQSEDAFREAAKKEFSLPAGRRPQAAIVDGDAGANGVKAALESLGLKPGEEIPLLNFGDSERSPFLFERKPLREMAEIAVERLAKAIKSGKREVGTASLRLKSRS